ncbi:SusC/RagA family TonB-linked outer membrane protein [Carboxylicivirga marina]|uniref:SusC/RagA family TonB-linked outer membrane protein n=1 Tax=Carboxylicivirga marina TaxID=2800988 RepID=UPI0025986335|nr:TonB-dependent receptor [uncultured Carboxylicivirga sp.]
MKRFFRTFIVCCTLLLSAVGVYAQQSVTGVVTDDQGDPVVGATVVIEGTTTGTITNFEGEYNLMVEKGQKLVISFIGFTTKTVTVGDQLTIDVQLLGDDIGLEEVVVTGYGSQKKMTVTGAISSINSDELLKAPTTSVSQALAGRITGITSVQTSGQPGADTPDLYIRGQGTFGDASPIFIVDGVERDFSQLDPNEIDNVTVLKDASATAVYGIRGANGVIIVTTKRGQKGKMKINASYSQGLVQPTRMLEMADSHTFATMWNEMKQNDAQYTESGLPLPGSLFPDWQIEAFRTGSDPIMFPDTDWAEYLIKETSTQRQANVNINGGTDKVKYFVSLGYFSQEGMFENYDDQLESNFNFNRYNYRANLDFKITNTTDLGVTVGGRIGDRRQLNAGDYSRLFRDIYWAMPMAGPGVIDGQWIKTDADYFPIEEVREGLTPYYGKGYKDIVTNTLNMDIDLKQDLKTITKGLSARFKFAYNTQYSTTKNHSRSIASYTPYYLEHMPGGALEGNFMTEPSDKTIVYRRNGIDTPAGYGETKGKARDWYMDLGLNYARQFGVHNVGGLLLYNQRTMYYPKNNGSYVNYADIPAGVVGIVGRVTYDYNTKYMAEFNVGYNGSENFHPDRRYGWFPAGSLGWVVSEESFMQNLGFLDYMKIRGSVGLVGNDKAGRNRFLYMDGPYQLNGKGYSFGIDNPQNQPGAYELSTGNPMVTWETALKSNIGVDLTVLDSHLSLNFDLFREDRQDILAMRQVVPVYTQYKLVPSNIGKMENKGFEAMLSWRENRKPFKYWISANVSYAKNKVIFRDEVPQPEDYMGSTGHPNGTKLLYMFDGLYTEDEAASHAADYAGIRADENYVPSEDYVEYGYNIFAGDARFKDLNGDGIIDGRDQKRTGYSDVPEITGGLNYGMSFKGVELTMTWTGATNVGRTMDNVFVQPFGPTKKRSLLQYIVDDRWTPETQETAKWPRLSETSSTHNYRSSDLYRLDASYIRLKVAELSYTFNKRATDRIGVSDLKIFVNGYNLLTYDRMNNIMDPEGKPDSQPKYPLTKIYNIGIKIGL